jgi:hypothetical protein
LSRAVLQAIFIFFRAFIIDFKTMNLLESYNRRIVFQKKKKKKQAKFPQTWIKAVRCCQTVSGESKQGRGTVCSCRKLGPAESLIESLGFQAWLTANLESPAALIEL